MNPNRPLKSSSVRNRIISFRACRTPGEQSLPNARGIVLPFYFTPDPCRGLFGLSHISVDIGSMMQVIVHDGVHIFQRQHVVIVCDLFRSRSGEERANDAFQRNPGPRNADHSITCLIERRWIGLYFQIHFRSPRYLCRWPAQTACELYYMHGSVRQLPGFGRWLELQAEPLPPPVPWPRGHCLGWWHAGADGRVRSIPSSGTPVYPDSRAFVQGLFSSRPRPRIQSWHCLGQLHVPGVSLARPSPWRPTR